MKLAKELKDKDVHVIAVEPQYPRNLRRRSLKQQVKDIAFAVVDPLETVDKNDLKKDDDKGLESPNWYLAKMRQNLEELAKALP